MKAAIPLITVLLLSACASTPSQTLDQKLSGKTGEDRKETLRLACLNEAEWPIYNSSAYKHANTRVKQHIKNRYNAEVSEMKSLCRKMDDLTTADAEEKLPPQELANMCADKVAAITQKGNTEHAARTKHICEEMTGKKIGVDHEKHHLAQ